MLNVIKTSILVIQFILSNTSRVCNFFHHIVGVFMHLHGCQFYKLWCFSVEGPSHWLSSLRRGFSSCHVLSMSTIMFFDFFVPYHPPPPLAFPLHECFSSCQRVRLCSSPPGVAHCIKVSCLVMSYQRVRLCSSISCPLSCPA